MPHSGFGIACRAASKRNPFDRLLNV
jgi:hypothetical protein